MRLKHKWKLFSLSIVLYSLPFSSFADVIANPCGGASALLNLVDRPTAADSACVVPFKQALLELGYEYQHLTHSAGYAQNYPEAEFRLGLPANNELVVVLPNYIHQSMAPHSGFTATTLGIKHEIGYNEHWLAAIEALVTLPNGSAAFGNKGVGVALNTIISYTINSAFDLTLMLGGTTETQSRHQGGQRYTSVNPDLVLTYTANEKLQLYGEIYGQSKTGPGQTSGFNVDAGFLYLVLPKLEFDMEVGQRISGNLGGFNHYIGAGMSILF